MKNIYEINGYLQITLGDLNRETRPSKELTKLMSDMESKHGMFSENIISIYIIIFKIKFFLYFDLQNEIYFIVVGKLLNPKFSPKI